MKTLLLDRKLWDLCKDAAGNIACAGVPYATIQDVASACRLFAAELWYDKSKGIPYFEKILGYRPPAEYFKAQIEAAAKTVPDVVKARCVAVSFQGRQLTGQIQIINTDGVKQNVQF